MRNGFVDYCRLIAAIGIVWFYTDGPGYMIAYAALPFFLVLLALPSRAGIPERARRLLLPFVVWSAIYGAQRVSDALQQGADAFGWWKPSMLLIGTADHLWFLPFAFICVVLAPLLRGWKLSVLLPVIAAAALSVLGTTQVFPWYQWSFGVIPALVGFAYFQARLLAVLPLIASYIVLEVFRPSSDNMVILAGSALAILALSVTMRPTKLSAWCARMSMWVYLGHMLVLSQILSFGFEGYPLVFGSIIGSMIFAMSIDIVMQRFSLLRGRRSRA